MIRQDVTESAAVVALMLGLVILCLVLVPAEALHVLGSLGITAP